ncbi:MAG: DNA-binding protein [Sulfuricurvum sp.]|uniref:DNA-binding protein n=1 Tax=Sulfuricurvum sp. TaxID=2025608 RepID=UPI00261A346A|nr:DNA-binding protein [Sulfuricurvum sp.]MDD2367899.1 DNA-binding protein [Sulfuricurvum sp.]MDD2950389.1 DNA-binding protein [Sulfuricurvum sp.]MDD5118534.1 DNA-binding protein [Sulfuricurvum sp.]
MKKMTIADAAEYFNVSKEAIHNRIRRGSLDCIVDNGVKYVAVESAKSNAGTNVVSDNRYTQYIEQENVRLREKVDSLEKETSRLRDQREQMLIDERVKVEQIYKERDAQLRSVLHVVATKFLSHVNTDTVMQEGMTVDAINADVVDSEVEEWISLKSFLKLKRVKDKEKKQIKRGFETALKNGDERLIPRGDKIFLNPSKFDYSDLLE